jgi:glutathione S-transferase
MFILFTTPLSANGRKVLMVSHHLDLRPEIKIVNVYRGEGRNPEYLAINPMGKVPSLVDGEMVLWESNAILLYMSETHADCRLWGREARRRADVARWLFWESSHWQPALISILTGFVRQQLFPEPAQAPVQVDWADPTFVAQAQLLEGQLAGRPYLLGDELTLADFSISAMMMYVRPAGFPFASFPNLSAWLDRMEALPAWQAAAAMR